MELVRCQLTTEKAKIDHTYGEVSRKQERKEEKKVIMC
jgi:hypothetical protein